MAVDRQISINIRAVTGELTSGLNKASAATKAWGSSTQATIGQVEASTERISRLWRAAFEAFLGFEAVNMLQKLATGAAEAASQLDVAQRVAKNFGHSLNPAMMEGWLEAFARSAKGGGYAIDEMRASVQQFSALGLDAAQTQRAIADTANLAAARNIDWATAAHVLQMALTGHVEMLTRYGYISREAAKNIHTVEQAVEAVEKATAGAAAERANTLPGAFGRLSTSASLLRDALGTGLIPMFEEVANVLGNIADDISKIPAPVLKAAAEFVGLATALAATVLVLPAIAKGFAIMGEGLRLLQVLTFPLVSFVLKLASSFGLAAAGADTFTAAELAMAAPIAVLVVAVAGITVAIVEMTNHLDHSKTAWKDWCQYLNDSFADFAKSFKNNIRDVGDEIHALANLQADAMSGKWGKLGGDTRDFIAANKAAAKSSDQVGVYESPKTKRDEATFKGDAGTVGHDIVSDWKKIGATVLGYFGDLFKSSLGKPPGVPGDRFSGIVPGKGGAKDTGPAAAANALKNVEEAIKETIARLANRVADARHNVEKSTTAVDQYKAGLPGGQPQNAAQQAELQKLITNELKAQQALHDRLQEQQQAEIAAASGFEKYAAKISTHLKNHDELVRQAKDAALEHVRAAQQLGEEYLRIGVTVAQLKNDIRASFEGLVDKTREASDAAADALYDRQKIQNEADQAAIQQQIDMLPYGGAGAVSFNGPAAEGPHERSARAAAETETQHPGSKNANVEADRLLVVLAALHVAIAQDAEDEKLKHVAAAQTAYDTLKTSAALKDLTDAQNAYAQSVVDAGKAQNAYVLATQKLIIDQQQKWDQLIDGLIQKSGAPGLSMSQTGVVSFDPMTFLFAAFEQSQAFGQVMATVTQIVTVFGEMLDALEPIIDALLNVVKAVANVFIFLYNMVARILSLMGIQVQQLQYLTSAISGLIPLIQIWHEIPTLNELAAGKLNSPLSTTPQNYGALPGSQGAGQNMLMKVVEVLTAIFGAVVVEKMFSGMNFQQAVHATAQLIGINASTKQQIPSDAANTAKINMTAAQDALKQSGLTMNSNTLLSQIWQTLQQMLAVEQTQSAGGGGFGGILGAILGGGGAGGAAGVAGVAGVAGGVAGAMRSATQTLVAAAQQMSQALSQNTRLFVAHSRALADATQRLTLFANALDSARAVAGGGSLSTALGMDMDRRISSTGYNINRVP